MSGGSTFVWKSETSQAEAAIMDGVHTGLQAAGDELLALSQAVVPVDTGALRDSGQVTAGGDETIAQVAVSYGDPGDDTGPEAIVQHEHMEYEHPNGGQAKFLEQPLYASAEKLATLVADAIHAQVGGPR